MHDVAGVKNVMVLEKGVGEEDDICGKDGQIVVQTCLLAVVWDGEGGGFCVPVVHFVV